MGGGELDLIGGEATGDGRLGGRVGDGAGGEGGDREGRAVQGQSACCRERSICVLRE